MLENAKVSVSFHIMLEAIVNALFHTMLEQAEVLMNHLHIMLEDAKVSLPHHIMLEKAEVSALSHFKLDFKAYGILYFIQDYKENWFVNVVCRRKITSIRPYSIPAIVKECMYNVHSPLLTKYIKFILFIYYTFYIHSFFIHSASYN